MKKFTFKKLIQTYGEGAERDEIELLLAYATRQTRQELLTHQEKSIALVDWLWFRWLFSKYSRGIPLPYLTHRVRFCGFTFFVNRHVLIPRSTTEGLAVAATTLVEAYHDRGELDRAIVIDIGTGNGCIPIAVAKTLKAEGISVVPLATDISKNALRVAKKNAKAHHVEIGFLGGDLLTPILEQFEFEPGAALIITAHLPYLDDKTIQEHHRHEPLVALSGGEKNDTVYRRFFDQLLVLRKQHQGPIHIISEISPSLAPTLQTHITSLFPHAGVTISPDESGVDRFVSVVL